MKGAFVVSWNITMLQRKKKKQEQYFSLMIINH